MNGERLCFSDPPEEAVTKGSPGGFLRLMLLSGGCGGGLRLPGGTGDPGCSILPP